MQKNNEQKNNEQKHKTESLSSGSNHSASTVEIPMFANTPQPKQALRQDEAALKAAAREAAEAAYEADLRRDAMHLAAGRADAAPQLQYVPVPVPMGAHAGTNGLYEDKSFAAPAPMMIPVPVPVPMPMGGSQPGPASFAAAAGRDFYNAMAFQENYQALLAGGYPNMMAPTAQQQYDAVAAHQSAPAFVPPPGFRLVRDEEAAQAPAGFVPPPGFKFVRAPVTDMQSHPQASWPTPSAHPAQFNSDRDLKKKQSPQRSEPKSNSLSAKVTSNGKVFVGGLSPATTSTMLHEHFSQYGKVIDVSVIQNPTTKKSRGFGYVEFGGAVPSELLEAEHVIDKRKCGVKLYTYEAH
jgi:hypothetical protein